MPIDPPFNDGRWPDPWLPQNGPAGGTPYPDWTDPFINLRAPAPYPFASAPAPFSAAQLGAMAWHPPIFSDDWPPPTLPPARTPTLGLSVPPGWPDPLQSTPTLAQSISPPPPGAINNLPALQSPFALGAPGLDLSGGPPFSSAYTPPGAAPPTLSVPFNPSRGPGEPGAPDPTLANLGQSGQTLGLSDLPLSKSGVPFLPPPPQLSEQWLSVAHLLSPNLVDYFTKTPPPAPPFPAISGKIPSGNNPYATGAVSEAAVWLLTLLSAGAAAPLGIAPVAEEAALQGPRIAVGARALIGGNLSPEASGRIVAALQAAVDAGSLTREQATVLLQRANGVGEAAGAKLEAPLSAWLPKYDGTTYGLLITNEGKVVPLQSGPPRSFANYPSSKHAEGKGGIWVRENGSTGGVFFHNNTGGTCGYCDRQLERLLPSQAVLDVVPPPDAVAKNLKAIAKPSWYVGDNTIPLVRPIKQPDLFGNQP
jgi:hypothetical protein